MGKPLYDLILGLSTMKELGIALDFWAKEINIDDMIVPMRVINDLTKSRMDKACCQQQHGTWT